MITDSMKKWLDSVPIKESGDPEKTVKYCVYMNRIQKRIDRELKNLLWLATNFPEVFLKERENEVGKVIPHLRLKTLIHVLKNLNPNIDVEMVLKRMDYPE